MLHHATRALVLSLAITTIGCATDGSDPGTSSAPRTIESLFDPSRGDVSPARSPDGRELGLFNATHRILWDYEKGYAQLDEDWGVVWGFEGSPPSDVVEALLARDEAPAPSGETGLDGVGSTQQAACLCACVRISGASYCVCICERY